MDDINRLRRLSGLPLFEAPVPVASPQQALDAGWFGPVYHGTPSNIDDILSSGFDIRRSVPTGTTQMGRPIGTTNGYVMQPYGSTGIAAPVHHLGFGIYFTSVKSIAKKFAGDTTRGMRTFYLDVDRVEEINFGAANTMMRWWMKNGYDMTAEATARRDTRAWIRATGNLTRTLRQKFDAVHFLGKGMHRLLDGSQIVVFDPKRIRVVDPKLATGLEIGAKVVHNQSNAYLNERQRNDLYVANVQGSVYTKLGDGWRGVFRAHDHNGNDVPHDKAYPIHFIPPPGMVGVITGKREGHNGVLYDVKWKEGGVRHNYSPHELAPVQQKQSRGN